MIARDRQQCLLCDFIRMGRQAILIKPLWLAYKSAAVSWYLSLSFAKAKTGQQPWARSWRSCRKKTKSHTIIPNVLCKLERQNSRRQDNEMRAGIRRMAALRPHRVLVGLMGSVSLGIPGSTQSLLHVLIPKLGSQSGLCVGGSTLSTPGESGWVETGRAGVTLEL